MTKNIFQEKESLFAKSLSLWDLLSEQLFEPAYWPALFIGEKRKTCWKTENSLLIFALPSLKVTHQIKSFFLVNHFLFFFFCFFFCITKLIFLCQQKPRWWTNVVATLTSLAAPLLPPSLLPLSRCFHWCRRCFHYRCYLPCSVATAAVTCTGAIASTTVACYPLLLSLLLAALPSALPLPPLLSVVVTAPLVTVVRYLLPLVAANNSSVLKKPPNAFAVDRNLLFQLPLLATFNTFI